MLHAQPLGEAEARCQRVRPTGQPSPPIAPLASVPVMAVRETFRAAAVGPAGSDADEDARGHQQHANRSVRHSASTAAADNNQVAVIAVTLATMLAPYARTHARSAWFRRFST